MKTVNKTLLVHTDTKTFSSDVVIVDESKLVSTTKAFLKKLSKKYTEAKIQIYTPLGVVLQSPDKKTNYAVAYEEEKFVIVAPNGTRESAKLYGNWDEALRYTQKLLSQQKKTKIILSHYQNLS